MKQLIFSAIMLLFLAGCKSTSPTATNLDRDSQNLMKGTWTLSSVNYTGSDVFAVETFQLADSGCFEGSTWTFVPNNNKGEMSINKSGCAAFSSPITWFVNRDGEFVLKILNAGDKARKVRDGYVLRVANQTGDSFELVDRVSIAGKMNDVTYRFNKLN